MFSRKSLAIDHFREYATIYIFMIILFLTGIIFGAVIVNSMNFVQKQDLFFYLERFFGRIVDGQTIEHMEILKGSFFYHVKYILLFFVLGLSVIGMPVIWILIFVKGLSIGFTVGFIVNQLGTKGLLLASIAVVPQNLLIIPIYIIASSLAMIFSLTLLKRIFTRNISRSIRNPFLTYTTIFFILLCTCIPAAALEAFVANEAIKMFVKSIY